jgi:hypothetical protein
MLERYSRAQANNLVRIEQQIDERDLTYCVYIGVYIYHNYFRTTFGTGCPMKTYSGVH